MENSEDILEADGPVNVKVATHVVKFDKVTLLIKLKGS